MFRLLTFCFSAVCLAAFVWFGLTVDLGERTLFGHVRAIVATPEAKELGKGIRTKVDDFVGIEAARRAAEEKARQAEARKQDGPPQDEHTAADREGLRKVTKPAPKAPKPAQPAGRPAAAPRPANPPRQVAARPSAAATARRIPEAGPGK